MNNNPSRAALEEEIRWVDEESARARRELEERVEARFAALESRAGIAAAELAALQSHFANVQLCLARHETALEENKKCIAQLHEMISAMVQQQNAANEAITREMSQRVDAVEADLDAERERTMLTMELVTKALTHYDHAGGGRRKPL